MKIVAGNELAFEASGKDVAAAFTKITGVTTYVKAEDTKYVIASIAKGDVKKGSGVYLIGTSSDALASIRLKGEAKKSGIVRVDAAVVSGMLKSRGDMEFSATGGKLSFKEKKGNFKANLDVTDFDAEDVRMLELQLNGVTKTEPLSKEILDSIKNAVKCVMLTDFYAGNNLPILFKLSEKSMHVYCYDPYHVAIYKTKIKKGVPMQLALPSKAFSTIDKFLSGADAEFSTSDGRFRVKTPEYIVSIPETQLDEHYYTQPLIYLEALGSAKKLCSVEVSTDAGKTIGNMAVLTDQETKMALTIDKKSVGLHVSGKGGSVSDSFKTKVDGKPIDMRVDPRLFMDLFNKVKEKSVNMDVYFVGAGSMSSYVFSAKRDGGDLTLIGTYDKAK